jgi:serine protease Do
VTDVGDFRNRVSFTPPGKTGRLAVIREGKRLSIEVIIGNLSEQQQIAQAPAESAEEELGLPVQTLTPQLAEQIDAKAGEGVAVTQVKPGSIAVRAGIKTGDVIPQINRKPVNSARQFTDAVKESRRAKRLLLLIRTGDM